jgi:hypothetical protein
VLSVPASDVKATFVTVGAVVSIVTASAEVDVWVSVAPSRIVIAVERNLWRPGASSAVMQLQTPVVESAVQAEPVLVHVPVVVSVSVLDDAVATDNCTLAPTGAEPVNVSVRVEVMLSESKVPMSDAAARSGVDTDGKAYRTTTIPEPPAAPA